MKRLALVIPGILSALVCFQIHLLLQQVGVQRLLEAEASAVAAACPPPTLNSSSLNRPPILFVHFHKSGGTSVCQSMRLFQNQLNITNALGDQPPSYKYLLELNNCNVEFAHPHLHDRDFASVQNCRMLEPYTMNDSGTSFQRNNFIAVEIPLHDRMPCPKFRSLAIMRDPVKRCVSHLLYERVSENMVHLWIEKKTPGRKRDFFMNGYAVINNMVIRQLLGRARFISARPIDEDDLEQAKAQVDKFDAFVPLEFLKHQRVLTLLNTTVPEYCEGLINNNRIRANQQPPTNISYSDQLVDMIREENKYDTMLYEYMLDKVGISKVSGKFE